MLSKIPTWLHNIIVCGNTYKNNNNNIKKLKREFPGVQRTSVGIYYCQVHKNNIFQNIGLNQILEVYNKNSNLIKCHFLSLSRCE